MSEIILPIRIQRSRKHKQTSPNGLPIVYIGRPTIWDNPYAITAPCTDGYKKKQVEKYRNLINGIVTPDMHPQANEWNKRFNEAVNAHPLEAVVSILKGKNLSCWCKEGEICHADVLLKIANADLILAHYNEIIPF